MSKKISFSAAIRHAASKAVPHMKVTGPGTKTIAKVISCLNDELVDLCRTNCKITPKNGHVTMEFLHKIVKEVMSDELLAHAISCASRNVMRYEVGLLNFKPKPLKQASKTQKKVFPEFTQGLPSIAASVYPGVKMETNAKSAMAKALKDLTTALSEKAKEIANNSGDLTYQDISKSLSEMLPPSIARHAIAEGARTLLLYESGCMTFDKKDFHVPKRHYSPRPPTKQRKIKKR